MAYCGLAPDGHENRSLNEVDVGLGPISKIRQPLMGQTHQLICLACSHNP